MGTSEHPPSHYLDRYYVDSVVFDERALRLLVETVGVDRVLVGSDYPYPLGERPAGALVRSASLLDEPARTQILSGNSLGLQPRVIRERIGAELDDWARLGVEAHMEGARPWVSYHELLRDPAARLVGARPAEVVVMNSLTVNLHLLMVSFYRPTPDRHKILVEGGAFPSDQYAVKSQIQFHGFDASSSLVELRPRPDEACLREEDIHAAIEREGNSIALILLGGVNYVTGQALDLEAVTEAGHKKGCIVGFDLAHAAGNIPLRLHDWDPDFAVWCNYKYLNGGPGCVGGCFVHQDRKSVV